VINMICLLNPDKIVIGGAEITNAAVENARDMKELADKAKIH
jgi:predicted NBD/HSP70 family sugar kinase